jgi:CheY-like chemotaxis protein
MMFVGLLVEGGAMRRVLLVDNEPPVRRMLADVLRGAGYGVFVAASGLEALEMLPSLQPDLVMVDVRMPGLDGWGTMAEVHANAPGMRVMMMSGADCGDEALSRGAIAFLAKPYRPADVLAEVERALRTAEAGAADAA